MRAAALGVALSLVLVGAIGGLEACRTLEPRDSEDDSGTGSSSGNGATTTRPDSSSSSSSGASTSGGISSSGDASSSSSSSGATPPPFDGGVILPAGDHAVGPADRQGTLTVPTGYTGEPMPLVLLLHGTGEDPDSVETFLSFKPTASSKGFFLLRAAAKDNAFGVTGWNADHACCSYLTTPPDDSTYLRTLVGQAAQAVAVDAKRIYVVGHSSGGFMAYQLACDHADVFAGIVSLAGEADDTTTCTPAAKVSVLQIQGDADTSVAYTGGSFGLGYSYPGAKASVAIWAGYNGCATALTTGSKLELVDDGTSNETTISSHGSCPAGAAAELWTMSGADHEPTFDSTFSTQVATWLLARPKP